MPNTDMTFCSPHAFCPWQELLCVGEPSKSALRDIRRQVMECIDTIETMMEEQSNDHL